MAAVISFCIISAAFYSTQFYLNTKFFWVIRLPSSYENKLTTCRKPNLEMDSITHLLRYCFDISMLETFICLYDRITRLEEFHEMFFGERPSVWSLEGGRSC